MTSIIIIIIIEVSFGGLEDIQKIRNKDNFERSTGTIDITNSTEVRTAVLRKLLE